ncbi:MAG: amidohydrolase family protein [Cryomorphaceae bacterium]|nr:amidohydrolase family protein [Cryomorphaceae bacterium]
MKNKVLFFIAVGALISCHAFGQTVLYRQANLHLGNGAFIENGQMMTEGVDIVWIGKSTDTPPKSADKTIDLSGKHVYPGFIAPATATGLVEVESVRATRDFREVGSDNPNARAAVAFNTDSRIHPTLKYNGILIVQATPEGGRFSGLSSVMHLDGRNWEEATLRLDDGLHINWPGKMRYNRSKGKLVENENYDQQVSDLVQTFKDAHGYLQGKPATINLKLAAFDGVFSDTKKVFVHVNKAWEIMDAVNKLKEVGVKHPVVVGGMDAHSIVNFLLKHEIPVILGRPHELPLYSDDAIDQPYSTPAQLQEAGVLFCLSNIGRMPVMGNRNIPFMAGTAVAYGLEYEYAVASITGNAAKILGIDMRYGTLEAGKSATFIVSDGDALNMETQSIGMAFIDGQPVDMENWQEILYRKWSEKIEKIQQSKN